MEKCTAEMRTQLKNEPINNERVLAKLINSKHECIKKIRFPLERNDSNPELSSERRNLLSDRQILIQNQLHFSIFIAM
ncbi:hypothetical protein CW304_22060 [Bacillus sp. UFRGS-B20]|nr:hypothetical protein CW304_22060 [Bacillus sp. UFRGS-B20]